MCISNLKQITLFYVRRFLKKLADDQCSLITKGSIYYCKPMSIQSFIMGVDWPEIGHIYYVWYLRILCFCKADLCIFMARGCPIKHTYPHTSGVSGDSILLDVYRANYHYKSCFWEIQKWFALFLPDPKHSNLIMPIQKLFMISQIILKVVTSIFTTLVMTCIPFVLEARD